MNERTQSGEPSPPFLSLSPAAPQNKVHARLLMCVRKWKPLEPCGGGRESVRMEDDLGIISERRGGRRGSGSKSSIWDGIFLSILLILDGFLNVLCL